MAVRGALLLAAVAVLPLAWGSLPPASQSWTQFGGPGRSGVADVAGDLDVLAAYNVTPDGIGLRNNQLGAFPTAHGVVGLWVSGGSCQLWRVADPMVGHVEPLGAAIPCPVGGLLTAALPGQDAVLACIDAIPGPNGSGLDAVLQARSARDGSLLWAVGPKTTTVGASGTGETTAWKCGDVGLDEPRGLMAVPFTTDQGANRLVAYAMADHHELWSLTFGPGDEAPAVPNVGPSVPAVPDNQASGNVKLKAATFTANGLLLTGSTVAASATTSGLPASLGTEANLVAPFAAWVDLDGKRVGSFAAATSQPAGAPSASTPVYLASDQPATQGTHAALAIENDLVEVDPSQATVVRRVPLASEPTTQQGDYAAPVWTREGLFLPFIHQAFLCDARDLAHCGSWTAYQDGSIHAALGPGDGTVWAVVSRAAPGRPLFDAVHLRLGDDTGVTDLAHIPLPLPRPDPQAQDPGRYGRTRFVPLDGGRVLVLDAEGDAVMLGPAADEQRPVLTLSDDQPPVNQPLVLHVTHPPGSGSVRQVLVGWGDGLLETYTANDTLQRQFTRKGDYEVRVTLVYQDNRTGTTVATAHVGDPKPAAQGVLQVLFGPKYQNYTFFAMGILVTVIGSVLTAVGVAKGRRRIDRRLRELDAIQDGGRRDPFAAVRELHDYRLDRRRDLAAGHLSDTQYTVLEAHAERVLQLLRQRILGAFVERVSESFSHALDLALADGSIDASEGSRLANLVGHESDLTADERRDLLAQLNSWRTRL